MERVLSRPWFMPAVLLILGTAAFFPALGGGFLSWDDQQHFQMNAALQSGNAAAFWLEPYYGFYIPVTYTVWTLLYKVAPQPLTFHLLNLLLHVFNAWLVFHIARRLLAGDKESSLAAPLAGVIFLLHPLQAEAVSWISGGRDVMAASLSLAAVAFALNARRGDSSLSWIHTSGAAAFFALGLLAKPGLFMLPLALWWLLHGWNSGPKLPRRLLAVWSLCGLAAAVGAVALQNRWALRHLPMVSPLEHVWVALDALGFYTGKLFFAWPLTADYGRTPDFVLSESRYLPSLVLLAAGVAAIYFSSRRLGARAWALAGFAVLTLLPVLGLVSFPAQTISTVFDRYMYFPMFAPALWLGLLGARLPRRLLSAVAAVAFVAWGSATFARAQVFSSNRALAEDMVAKNPSSYEGLNNLANEELAAGNTGKAVDLLRQARDLKPELAVAWSNLAFAYWQNKDLQAILTDIEPLTQKTFFAEYNASEPQALALMNRMTARALAALRRNEEAKESYCRAKSFDPADKDLDREVSLFLEGGGC